MSLLDDLYRSMYKDIPDLTEVEWNLSEQVETIMEQLKDTISPEDFDRVTDVVFQAVNLAEQEGFKLGMKFMLKFILECLT